jgi:hypothetical protein
MRIGRHLVFAFLSLLAAGAPLVGQSQELIDRLAGMVRRDELAGVGRKGIEDHQE